MERVCAHCGAAAASRPLPTCSKCGCARYCGAECQRAAWKAHKASCRAAAELQTLLNTPSVIGSAAALRAALAPHNSACDSLAPFVQARLFVLRALLAEKEASSGDPAHDAHAAAFGVIARCPAALREEVAVGAGRAATRALVRDLVADASLLNYVLACCRFCLNNAGGAGAPGPLPPNVLSVLRALAFDDAQPAFVQLLAAWALACSSQFGGYGSELTHVPAAANPDAFSLDTGLLLESRGAPGLAERIRCHAHIEALAPAARAEMPSYLKGHIDVAAGEAVAFNAQLRAAGGADAVDWVVSGTDLGAEA
jgi:hypothetical protein